MKYAFGLQVSLVLAGFTIIPVFAGDIWNGLPASFRWTVYISQLSMIAGGFFLSRALANRQQTTGA